MTERLRQLLGDEAGVLDVPPPSTDAVLRQGRGLRRRNRLVAGAAGVAAAVVVGGSVVALAGDGGGKAAPDPSSPTISDNAVFSYGNQVFYDGPSHRAEIQDNAVKSLFYTSAGVVVRHGDSSASDGGGPQRFSLVSPDGTVERLGLETEETVHASDVDQQYIAYAEAVDGELQAVVYDVAADVEEARVTVGATAETWFPVSIDDETLYVQDGYDNPAYAVDWRSGEVSESDIPSVWNVAAGRVTATVDGESAVVDVATGDVLVSSGSGSLVLSPDGRYAALAAGEEAQVEPDREVPTQVFDLESGSDVTVFGTPYDWGWTADGDLFQVEKSQVRTCDTATGECTTEPYAQPDIPEPDPITYTMSDPVCPDGGLECHTDPEFYENCAENPDQCEWRESEYVEEQTIELRLGGRTYES
ncbi:hypothetical protein [Nocardioides antri]|uniref:WD40 repeat domain-containing protein n=1 Tax=Nocardioides antri TaxID=2607659 RepID=A0A5B1LZK8_9ACTN|nr:hypothetical protein [Nocardioides antri]KAA1425638.1 hypothetical protein F0U47_17785 [Nocardioides antri]